MDEAEDTEEPTIELWEGAFALAEALDRMAEGARLDRTRLLEELELTGADAGKVVAAMLDSGLFVEVWSTEPLRREFVLTQAGRLLIIHLTSIL